MLTNPLGVDVASLFLVVPGGRTRANGHKLQHKEHHLTMRRKFLMSRVVEHRNRLLRKVMESPSLE